MPIGLKTGPNITLSAEMIDKKNIVLQLDSTMTVLYAALPVIKLLSAGRSGVNCPDACCQLWVSQILIEPTGFVLVSGFPFDVSWLLFKTALVQKLERNWSCLWLHPWLWRQIGRDSYTLGPTVGHCELASVWKQRVRKSGSVSGWTAEPFTLPVKFQLQASVKLAIFSYGGHVFLCWVGMQRENNT